MQNDSVAKGRLIVSPEARPSVNFVLLGGERGSKIGCRSFGSIDIILANTYWMDYLEIWCIYEYVPAQD